MSSALWTTSSTARFEEWTSAKTAADKYSTDLQDVWNYLDNLKAKLKKDQPESTTATMAKKETKKGMTDNPTVPADQAEKAKKSTEEIAQFQEH